jgi:molecular chaperone IbpA
MAHPRPDASEDVARHVEGRAQMPTLELRPRLPIYRPAGRLTGTSQVNGPVGRRALKSIAHQEDLTMRSFDLSPLFRYSVGFDRLDDLFETAFRSGQEASYPPYNIIKTGQDNYRITLAVAGFGEDELEVVAQENLLVVRGKAANGEQDKEVTYLHRGIARRAFEHRFQLADHVKVTGANLTNGLLDIELVRELPEAMKPQQIKIGTAAPRAKAIDDQSRKAA